MIELVGVSVFLERVERMCNAQLPVSLPDKCGMLVGKNQGVPTTGQADINPLIVFPHACRTLEIFWYFETLAYLPWFGGLTIEAQLHSEIVATGRTTVNREGYRNESVSRILPRQTCHYAKNQYFPEHCAS
jgi:hypothetical protein